MEQDGLAYMARCFAEEFAHMGYSEDALLAIFRDPFYQGPNLAYKLRGEEWVRDLIRRVIA